MIITLHAGIDPCCLMYLAEFANNDQSGQAYTIVGMAKEGSLTNRICSVLLAEVP